MMLSGTRFHDATVSFVFSRQYRSHRDYGVFLHCVNTENRFQLYRLNMERHR